MESVYQPFLDGWHLDLSTRGKLTNFRNYCTFIIQYFKIILLSSHFSRILWQVKIVLTTMGPRPTAIWGILTDKDGRLHYGDKSRTRNLLNVATGCMHCAVTSHMEVSHACHHGTASCRESCFGSSTGGTLVMTVELITSHYCNASI
jgi:hypothetical protein